MTAICRSASLTNPVAVRGRLGRCYPSRTPLGIGRSSHSPSTPSLSTLSPSIGMPVHLSHAFITTASAAFVPERRAAGMCASVDRPAPTTLCKLTAVRCSIRRTRKSRSRRCHDVWHMPGSNWRRRDSTGTHSTLRLTESGTVSVDCARFKSPLAHSVSPSQKTIHGRLWAQLDCLPSVSSAA